MKVVAKVNRMKLRHFVTHPASYVYLSVSPKSRPNQNPILVSYLRFEFISNPGTVASVDEEEGELILVTQQMDGLMTNHLARLASLQEPDTTIALNFDGPYGVAADLEKLAGSKFDRVRGSFL